MASLITKPRYFTTLPIRVFPTCEDVCVENRVKGELHISRVNINAKDFVLEELSPNDVKLQFYFTCCCKTSILNVNMHMDAMSGDLDISKSGEAMADARSSYAIYYGGVYIGCVVAELPDAHTCGTCNDMTVLPVLVVKLFVYQDDGSDRLLGFGKINVFDKSEAANTISLSNVNLSAFMYGAKSLLCTATFEYKVIASPLMVDASHAEMFEDVVNDETLLYSPLDVNNDSPFNDIYDPYRAGIACSIVATDSVILPKSAFYALVGKYITCTFEWACAMVHFQVSTYKHTSHVLVEKIKSIFKFDFKQNMANNVSLLETALLTSVDGQAKELMDYLMHIVINSIGAFVYICNIYSYDAYEVEHVVDGKMHKSKLDTERNTIYNILAEGTYDCEDGAGIMAVIYTRIKECFLDRAAQSLVSKGAEDGDYIYYSIGLFMNQYEPMLCAVRTSEISYNKQQGETDAELFGHMGAILLPKYFIEKTFKRCDTQIVKSLSDLTFTDCHYLLHEENLYVKDVGLDILIMESTTPVYSNPLNVILDMSCSSAGCTFDAFVVNVDTMAKPLCYALSDNIKRKDEAGSETKKCTCSIYEDIVSIHPLQMGDSKYHYKVGTFYIKYGDETGISLENLIKLNKGKEYGDVDIYCKYIIPDIVLSECAMYLKVVSPALKLDIEMGKYKTYYGKYVEPRMKSCPLYQEFVESNAAIDSSVIPYLPGILTNNNTDIEKVDRYLCLRMNPDNDIKDMVAYI